MEQANRGGPLGFDQGHQSHSQLKGRQQQASSSSSPLKALLKEYM